MGGVLVGAIASVHDVRSDMLAEKMGGAGAAVPHDHHIHFHGQNIIYGIDERFSFFYGAIARGKIQNICRESFFRQLKTELGTGGVLKKDICDGDIAQGRDFFNGPIDDLLKVGGCFEDELDIGFGKAFDAEEVARAELGHG
ncbi:hypothetical protein A3SI_14174 [Nitritalea halalkaliphila LW7]|uniref:Uncharacterized protein n=1 Tax=Nitritalea halalkaliphila LW7 TaxID=1189621 RepID=I5BZX2_9BACT|nr:hypothetical protein A3SI_14174 [Nitritalea halalkaliphila LW7]